MQRLESGPVCKYLNSPRVANATSSIAWGLQSTFNLEYNLLEYNRSSPIFSLQLDFESVFHLIFVRERKLVHQQSRQGRQSPLRTLSVLNGILLLLLELETTEMSKDMRLIGSHIKVSNYTFNVVNEFIYLVAPLSAKIIEIKLRIILASKCYNGFTRQY